MVQQFFLPYFSNSLKLQTIESLATQFSCSFLVHVFDKCYYDSISLSPSILLLPVRSRVAVLTFRSQHCALP